MIKVNVFIIIIIILVCKYMMYSYNNSLYIYIYIYIYRERERERERSIHLHIQLHPSHLYKAWTIPTPSVPQQFERPFFSFPVCSARGPDGLRPQHLKDILSSASVDLEGEFMQFLSECVNLVAQGAVPTFARPFLFGSSLIGLNKSDGAVRPIAVGCTL